MTHPSVSVCFPAYNEEASIRDVVEEAVKLLEDADFEYEILVCDDGSEDATGRIIDELHREIPELRVFHNPENQGMRNTWELLYAKGEKEFVFLNAVDRQWPTQCLFELLPLAGEYDVIVASRIEKHYGPFRRLVSVLYNAVPRWLFGVETYDAGAVKLVRAEIIRHLPVISRSPFTEAERLIRAARAGYRITAVPVETRPRETGVATGAKLGVLAAAAWDVPRVWLDVMRSPKRPPREPRV